MKNKKLVKMSINEKLRMKRIVSQLFTIHNIIN